jgi:hypothetical protein
MQRDVWQQIPAQQYSALNRQQVSVIDASALAALTPEQLDAITPEHMTGENAQHTYKHEQCCQHALWSVCRQLNLVD